MSEPSKQDEKWIAEQDKLVDEGIEIALRASDAALEYMADAVENISDHAWRKMAISTQAVEMGIGKALAEKVIPAVHHDMKKKLAKKTGLPKPVAHALIDIYIGQVIKNIRKELNARDR